MFCPICGTNLPENAVQCTACGTVLGSSSQNNMNQQTNYNTQSTEYISQGNYSQNGYENQTGYTQQFDTVQQIATQQNYNQQGSYSNHTPQKKSNSNIIIPIAIGGGVLFLALIIVIIAMFSDGGDGPETGYNPPVNPTEATTGGDETTVVETDVVEETVVVVDNSFVPYGYVTYRRVFASDGLNIRKMPTMNSERVITISNLNMVSVMGYSKGNPNWVYVRYLGKEGWVDSRYLSQVSVANFRVTMKDGLNLRKGPGTNYDKVYADVPEGDVVQFIRYNGNATWAYVSYAGYYGWMSASYLLGTYEDATVYELEPEVLYNCDFDKEYIVTMDDYLNLRSNPTTKRSRIYTAIPEGATVYLGGYNRDKSWAFVLYDYYTGWVDADYIRPAKEETTAAPKKEVNAFYEVTSDDGLNLRTEPSDKGGKSTIILEIPYQDVVYVVYTQGNWAFVEYAGGEGWVSAKYIKKTDRTPDDNQNSDVGGDRPAGLYKVIMSDGLNLRTEPSTDGGDDTVILEIPYGATVEVIEYNQDYSWAEVEYEGEIGWVSAKQIEYIG